MYSLIDIIVLFASVALLGVSIATTWLALSRSRKQNEELQAAAQLQKWRESGLLIMTDEDYHLALELFAQGSGQLEHVVRAIRRILDEGEPAGSVRLSVTVEYEDEPERVTKETAKTGSHKGHLELTAEFA